MQKILFYTKSIRKRLKYCCKPERNDDGVRRDAKGLQSKYPMQMLKY